MKPAFKEAAATLATQTSKARLAMIDCTDGANQPICEKHEIKGYPTLKLFKAGKFVENYQQHRTAVAMLAYINSQIEEKAPRPVRGGFVTSEHVRAGNTTLQSVRARVFKKLVVQKVDTGIHHQYNR